MEIEKFFKSWYRVFATNVSKDIMNKRVLSKGNLPWHIFTWGEVGSIEGLEALNCLKKSDFTEVIAFSGYPNNFSKIKKIKSNADLEKLLDNRNDIYITAKDFSWTFVKTHESNLGPYFKFKELKNCLNWYWDGLHDAKIIKVAEVNSDIKNKKNYLELLLDSRQAIVDNKVKNIRLYDYKFKDGNLESIKTFWISDSLEKNENRYIITLETADIHNNKSILKIEFDYAEVKRH
ncbi:DUF4275 family protein [Haploplasma axanthum]|uniref:Uncharacterized protein n=1 Tax=Haploplasma axanthum TaxID=29552 RepID=A0A449BC64_HAPAX|nr:DUF4275 family protein [Haploplasma axanthum]VEU80026.1 Uncharacterised protein [Haploplasma axanthum]